MEWQSHFLIYSCNCKLIIIDNDCSDRVSYSCITTFSLASIHSLMMPGFSIAYTSYWRSRGDDLHIHCGGNFKLFSFTLSRYILRHPFLWWQSPKLYFNDGDLYLAAKYLWSWKDQKELSMKAGVWQMMSVTKNLTRHMIRVPWLWASDSWNRPAVGHEKENGSWNGGWELKAAAVLGDTDLGALYLLKHLQSIIKGKGKNKTREEREKKRILKKVVRTCLRLGEHKISSRMDHSDNETLEPD